MSTCNQLLSLEARPSPQQDRRCGAPGCERAIKGGLAEVREVLCDFHAQMYITRGFLVLPCPQPTGKR